MSAFLGPIHYWLYNKIRIQQEIVDELYVLGRSYRLNLEEDCLLQFGEFLNKPLEEMIDQGNIHGWLQERVAQVECKYAYCIIKLLQADSHIMSRLTNVLNKKGRELGSSLAEEALTAPAVFQLITDHLLDGMPCDHANLLVSKSDDEVVWKRNLCVHQRYWDELDGDIHIYYELRNAWLGGLVQEIGYSFDPIDSVTYSIRKSA